MKKRILTIALVAALLATCFAGTYAYLTDTDEAVNTFTMGNVKIVQNEYERVVDENGVKTAELQKFTNEQKVFPAVYELKDVNGNNIDPARANLTVNGSTFSIRNFPNYVDKMVTVENKGNSDAYVRVIIAVPVIPNDSDADNDVSQSWLHWNAISDSDTQAPNGWYYGTTQNQQEYPENYSDHYIIHNVEIDGKLYDLTVATNVNALAPGKETAPCMTGFYLDNDLNCDENGWFMPCDDEDGKFYITEANEDMVAEHCILVATQAVQAKGFSSVWEAFLNSFGEITATSHPWAE